MRTVVPILAAVFAASTLVLADERSVTADPHVDFRTIRTFRMHDAKVASGRPELNNDLYARQLGDAVRNALTAKGLKEVSANPDVVVDCSLMTTDGTLGADGQRGRRGPATGSDTMSFTDSTIAVALSPPGADEPIWRGAYRDPNDSAASIAKKTPEFVTKLLAAYPPKRKK